MSSKSVFYSLVLLNILTEGGVVRATTTGTPVNRGNGALFEIKGDMSPTKVPDVKPLMAGDLDTDTRTFDLVVTGNCATGEDPKLDIKPGAVRPDFFHVDENSGKLLYAEPQPMTIITMPKGHSASVDITLSNVNHIDSMVEKVKDYICLGIKRDGVISDEVLYTKENDTTHASAMIEMNSEDVVELVPLLSTTALSSGYTKATPGSEATLVSESIDFSSVYRVNVEPVDPNTIPMDVEWSEVQGCDLNTYRLDNEDTWFNYGAMGVGPIKVGDIILEKQLLAISEKGNLAYSSDGVEWKPYGSVLNDGEDYSGWNIGPVYGGGMWCIGGINGIKYLHDDDDYWSNTDKQISNVRALAFGDGVFKAVIGYTKIYRLSGSKWEEEFSVDTDSHVEVLLIYGNKKWVMTSGNCNVYELDPATEGATWQDLGYKLGSYLYGYYGGVYAHGYYYGVNDGWVRFSNDKKSSEEFLFPPSGVYNITLYNDKLYAFYGGYQFVVGTFVKPKPTE